MALSPSGSFKGWHWKGWLKGNKEAAKLFISALFGFWIPSTPQMKVFAGAALKLVLDVLDYYASEVKLDS